MPTSSRAASLADDAVRLAHGAWVQLGISGWGSTHDNWAIDPEPLILFTAWLDDEDPRLRDEARDWCIRNWRYVSKSRLRNLLREAPSAVQEPFGVFAATVSDHAGISWPGAADAEAAPYTVTGKSERPDLHRPAMGWLRLRAIFGVGARTEILRCFLAVEGGAFSVSRLAKLTGYTKRNVADECDQLARAGLLSVRTRGSAFIYSLRRRSHLEALVGEVAPIRPHWPALLAVTRELVVLERRAEDNPATVAVHAQRALGRMLSDLDELNLEGPSEALRGAALWPAIFDLGEHLLGAWAAGRWSADDAW